MSGWRYWFAFEARPGITKSSQKDLAAHCRALREDCRRQNGKIDVDEYMRWVDLIVDYSNVWGYA